MQNMKILSGKGKHLNAGSIRKSEDESLRYLTCGIAHDLNNILTIMLGHTQLALMDVHGPASLKANLEEVVKAGCRGRDLVKQIIDLRCRTGNVSPIMMGEVINESLGMLQAMVCPEIEIRGEIVEDGLVMADPVQIHRIIMNLCTNAIQAMEGKGGVLEVSLHNVCMDVQPSSYLKLIISDTGHGMTPEIIDRIFDPFFTTKQSGKGTGLGLSVVFEIVKSYKGFIVCNSSPGEGTTFEIYLPGSKADKRMNRANW